MTRITTDGQLEIAKGVLKNVVVEDIGHITGWLVGELHFKIKDIQGDNVLVEFGVRDPETKRLWVSQDTVWVPLGSTVDCENENRFAFYVAQHINNIAL